MELVGNAGPEGDVRDLIKIMNTESSAPASTAAVKKDTGASPSNRALKRVSVIVYFGLENIL